MCGKIVQLSLKADTGAIRRLTISSKQSNAKCSGTAYDAITVKQNAFLYDRLIRFDLIESNKVNHHGWSSARMEIYNENVMQARD